MIDELTPERPWRILAGDCLETMRTLPDASIDAVVCDPPYALPGGFMGKAWDNFDGREDVAFGYWLAGFTDGEGCFRVQKHERGTHNCAFQIKVRDDDRAVIERIRRFVGHGSIGTAGADKGSAPQVRYVVQDKEGCLAIVGLFRRFPLTAKKALDFEIWAGAVEEWTERPRGNRWVGMADQSRAAALKARLEDTRRYTGIAWSGHKFQDWVRQWATEAFRVMKPGAHLVAFGGTRTYHRLACAIEDAGFEVRDCLSWMYGSGFPKSLDVGKAIDSLDAPEPNLGDALTFTRWLRTSGITRKQIREATGTYMDSHYMTEASQPAIPTPEHWALIRPLIPCEIPAWVDAIVGQPGRASENLARREVVGSASGSTNPGFAGDRYNESEPTEWNLTKPHTPEAQRWHGWGTALKPAWEPIILARKPLAGTVARNVLQHGTGAINVDGCRIGTEGEEMRAILGGKKGASNGTTFGESGEYLSTVSPLGRWPANVILDEEAGRQLDEISGEAGAGGQASGVSRTSTSTSTSRGAFAGTEDAAPFYGDAGGASRFFYCAKASREERDAGLDGFRERAVGSLNMRTDGHAEANGNTNSPGKNVHPTVKPIDLMRWLVRLVTPPGGVVLDPFTGSGSTGCAAVLEGMRFVGCDKELDYLPIIEARVAYWHREKQHAGTVTEAKPTKADPAQASLFD